MKWVSTEKSTDMIVLQHTVVALYEKTPTLAIGTKCARVVFYWAMLQFISQYFLFGSPTSFLNY